MVIELPLYLVVGKRNPKKVPLNLNHYRNAHFHLLNSMKIAFKELVQKQIFDFTETQGKPSEPVKIYYQLFLPSKRKADISNIMSIVDKYFQDALVECGFLEDDNYTIIPKVVYEFIAIDKEKPRAVAHISKYNRNL